MELALETKALTKRFGDLVAVDGVDLAVPRGSLFGFLGPNGAGKSTTIKCLTGLLRPTSGEVRILGLDPADDPVAVKRLLGVVPEDLALFERLSALENLDFVGRVYGLDAATRSARAWDLLEVMALGADSGVLVADYSHGMRKKLALAMALLPAPRLLFLDEPFEGIDALVARQIRVLLQRFVAGGGTLFLTSHILEIVDRLCDHIAIIARGKLVAQGTLEELRAGHRAGAAAGTGTGATGTHADGSPGSVEDIYIGAVGAGEVAGPALGWLGG